MHVLSPREFATNIKEMLEDATKKNGTYQQSLRDAADLSDSVRSHDPVLADLVLGVGAAAKAIHEYLLATYSAEGVRK